MFQNITQVKKKQVIILMIEKCKAKSKGCKAKSEAR